MLDAVGVVYFHLFVCFLLLLFVGLDDCFVISCCVAQVTSFFFFFFFFFSL